VTVTALGSTTSTANDTVITLTVGAGANVGDLVVVVAGSGASARVPSSIADSAGNTYTVPQTGLGPAGGNPGIGIGRSILTAALTSGVSTITVTYTGASVRKAMAAIAWATPGTTPDDQKTAANGTTDGAGVTVTSGATTQAAELVVGVGAHQTSNANDVTQNNSFIEFLDVNVTSKHFAGYKEITATGTQTYAPTFTAASANWAALVMTFERAASRLVGERKGPVG